MDAKVTYVGHATVWIEIDGVRLITDPVFRRRLLHLRRHGAEPAAEHRGGADAILLSHLHLDHADMRSLRELGTDVPVIAPAGSGDFLRGKGIADVTELGVGEGTEVGGVRITGTDADHEGRRVPFVGHRGQTMGFEIAGSQRLYFAGDTDLFDGMAELAGGLDLALLPVWGWGSTLGEGHLDPERAAQGGGAAEAARRRPDPLGHVLPLRADQAARASAPRPTA